MKREYHVTRSASELDAGNPHFPFSYCTDFRVLTGWFDKQGYA